MHDSVKRSAAACQQGRHSSDHVFGYGDNYITASDSVRVKMEPRDYTRQSAIGLDMIHDLPLTPSVSMHSWQDQPVTGTTACYNTAVSAPDYSPLPYYQQHQQYANSTLVDAPSIQYPAFTSHAQGQPLYYTSSYNASQTGSPDYGQSSLRRWTMTPQSHISTPERIINHDIHHSSPTEKPWPSPILLNDFPQSRKNTSYKNANTSLGQAHDGYLERSPSPQDTSSISGSDSSQERSLAGSVSPGATEKKVGRKGKSSTRPKGSLEADAELRCQICGKQFTRRSNCREHIKRHNPSNRQVHACSGCGKTFGRKTDLRRHYSTRIHDGEKRFACELCGRFYSRLDTMYRHQKDGCPERRRKIEAGKSENPVHAIQNAQTRPSK